MDLIKWRGKPFGLSNEKKEKVGFWMVLKMKTALIYMNSKVSWICEEMSHNWPSQTTTYAIICLSFFSLFYEHWFYNIYIVC